MREILSSHFVFAFFSFHFINAFQTGSNRVLLVNKITSLIYCFVTSLSFFIIGMYVMVAGQLKVMGSPKKQQSPCVKVLKFADLSSNPHSEALWMAEVIHMQSHFKDQQNV